MTYANRARKFDAARRVVYSSSGRRLLLAFVNARDAEGRRVGTLTDLAARAHVTVQALSLVANGLTREPSLRLAIALRDLVGIPVDAWLAD